MEVKEFRISYTEYGAISQLPEHIQKMVDQAIESARKAYAPFSKFQVGAAVELADGQIRCGNNQENKAYPSGLCAERSLLFYVNGNYPEIPIVRLVVVAMENGEIVKSPVYPCGACRQVMTETEERFNQAIETWMIGSQKTHVTENMDALLPLKFTF